MSASRPHESRQLTQSPSLRRHAAPHRGQASGSGCRGIETVIRVYDVAGNVIETHEHKGDFREP